MMMVSIWVGLHMFRVGVCESIYVGPVSVLLEISCMYTASNFAA